MNAFNSLSVLLLFFLIWLYFAPSDALNFDYHNEEELEAVLRNFSETTKNINTKLYSIGKSTSRGTPLWVMQLSSADKSRKMVPNIKFVGNIHGNEAVGREMLLHFMEYLRDYYEKDNLVKCLLDNSNIHLLPCMNPDGFNVSLLGQCTGDHGRKNGENGETEDLNRNFPDYYHENRNPQQRETKALMEWMDDIPFILSAGLHGGAMVANYPFDTRETEITDDSMRKLPSKSPDDDVFKHLSSVYASNNPEMKGIQCKSSNAPKFENGITNGAAWYSFQGGMQDYNYYKHGCMEITLEISCCKYPKPDKLPDLWEQNKKALLMYSLEALRGVSGQILDDVSRKPIRNAILKISGRNMTFRSTKDGEFWRILLPGKYSIEVTATGYHDQIENFTVKEIEENACPQPTELRILLTNSSIPRKTPSFESLRQAKSVKNEISNISPRNTVSYDQAQRGPPSREKEGENFVKRLFEDSELNVSKLDIENIKTFLRDNFSISDDDINTHFQGVIESFHTKNPEEKATVFIEIFDVLLGTPVKNTDTKWLIDFVNNVHITTGLRKDNVYFRRYNHSSEFGKIEIILLFNDLFEQKNNSGRLSVFPLLIISLFLMVFMWK